MGGVLMGPLAWDLFDQHVATYRIAFRSKKWYWPLLIHGIDAAVSNSWVMFRSSGTRAGNQLDFRRSIVPTYLMWAAANITQLIPSRIPVNVRYEKWITSLLLVWTNAIFNLLDALQDQALIVSNDKMLCVIRVIRNSFFKLTVSNSLVSVTWSRLVSIFE